MDQPYPTTLETDPIAEAIFELRFRPRNDLYASEILPGVLYKDLQSEFPKFSKLAATNIPIEIRSRDPKLIYAPTNRFDGDQYAIQTGDRVFNISCKRPYHGWPAFRDKILNLVDLLRSTEIFDSIERFSLKYSNLIEPQEGRPKLKLLDANAQIGPFDLNEHGCNLTTEIKSGDTVTIINIVTSAEVVIPGAEKPLSGLLLNIDTIHIFPEHIRSPEFWESFGARIDDLRAIEKNIFFSLMSNETVARYGPVFDEKMQ